MNTKSTGYSGATSKLAEVRLVISDLGGVIRDTSRGLDAGYRAGFEREGLPYNYDYQDTWHLRGIGKYDIGLECIKALLALELRAESSSLPDIIKRSDAEVILDRIVNSTLDERGVDRAEQIRLEYKRFFNSEIVRSLVSIHPFSESAVRSLSGKGYKVALLTNGNRVTVERDVSFTEAFDLILSEDEVAKKKPSGDGIRRIMSRLNFSAEQTIFVCDASVDIKAAKDAGIMSAAVLSGMGLKVHLLQESPDMILKDLSEFDRLMLPVKRN